MSVSFHRGGWEVALAGRRRAVGALAGSRPRRRRARSTKRSPRSPPPTRRTDTARHGRSGGVYSYQTGDGVRWRFVYRRSDGTQTTKRGFASERAARDARRRLIEQVERGEVRHTKETFAGYWERWLAQRRPYLEAGTWTGYEIAGRKRLLPAFGARSLGELSVDDVREFLAELAEEVEAGEVAPKTVNNALGTLVVCLNSAVQDGLLAVNPALRVQRLPPAHIERDYLRLDEIPRYLDACSDVYRPLAELLIGSGLRISEALALRVGDLELDGSGGTIVVYRSRKSDSVGSTKSDRFRAVEIGPGLCCRAPRSGRAPRRARGRRPGRGCPVRDAGPDDEAEQRPLGERRRRAGRSTAPRSRAIGTRTRSRTPRCATCLCTRSATPPRPRGSPPATR